MGKLKLRSSLFAARNFAILALFGAVNFGCVSLDQLNLKGPPLYNRGERFQDSRHYKGSPFQTDPNFVNQKQVDYDYEVVIFE
jgi:hypothetical protein